MRKCLTIPLLLFTLTVSQAQKKLPAFTRIEKADLEMKDCDFDPGAEALVLIDFADIEFSYGEHIGWFSESNYRVRVKVLKEKAVKMAEIKLRILTKNRLEEITNVKGISFNLDAAGNIEESVLEKSSVFERSVNKDHAEISFALPNVRVGTVFEYRYKLTRRSFSHIPTWTFQQSIPVRYSGYNIIVPEYFEFTTNSIIRQKLVTDPPGANEKGAWYIMENIPGLKEEPFSTGRADFLQRIEFKLSAINMPGYYQDVRTTWPKIIEELMNAEEFGGELRKNIRGTSDLNVMLAGKSPKEKVRLVYNYVQRHMRWDETYGFVTYEGIKNAWDKKSGSMAEINLLLINLLNDAGVNAKPLLISTRDNGKVNTFYPFINHFNGVMAYYKDGDDAYIMNAADKYNPWNQVPYDVAFTYGLLVDRNGGGIIPLITHDKAVNNVFFTCNIEPDGKLGGQATLKSSGYERNKRLAASKQDQWKEIFQDNNAVSFKVDSVTTANESDEQVPFEETAQLSGNLQPGGDYWFLPFSLFSGFGKNEFLAENRVTDIDFNYPKSYIITGTYYLPSEFVVNDLPKNVRMIMPDTSIVLSRKMQHDGDMISFRFEVDIKVFGYGFEAYPYVREFFKKMYEIMDEKIVLKKK